MRTVFKFWPLCPANPLTPSWSAGTPARSSSARSTAACASASSSQNAGVPPLPGLTCTSTRTGPPKRPASSARSRAACLTTAGFAKSGLGLWVGLQLVKSTPLRILTLPFCRFSCTLPRASISLSACTFLRSVDAWASRRDSWACWSSDFKDNTWVCRLVSASCHESSALSYRFFAPSAASSSFATSWRRCSAVSRFETKSLLVAISHSPMRLSMASSDMIKPPLPWKMSVKWNFKASTLDTVLLRTASFSCRIVSSSCVMRESRWLHRELSAVHCSCCFSIVSRTSACQAEATLAAACSAMASTPAVISFLATLSSLTHWFRARKESLNSARLPRDPQSCRNCSTDWLSRVSSLTCICTWAVAFRSTLRQSSNRDAKCENFVLSTTACMALTQSIASAWNSRRHISTFEVPFKSGVPAVADLLGDTSSPGRTTGVTSSGVLALLL
mmetsp:Transcript_29890/g.70493  ORF Transcript_29890/g.70493 Transcript_29890/m.70493 type:complete len:446 (-) Transcript_29890:131-1468(-)